TLLPSASASGSQRCHTNGWSTERARLLERRRALGGSDSERVDLLRQGALAVRGLVLVDHALRDGLVELLRSLREGGLGSAETGGCDGATRRTNERLQLALDDAVALARLLVGLVALDLRLDVCHVI